MIPVISRLVCDSAERLGRNGVEDFVQLPLFAGIAWDKLRQSTPPFVPELVGDVDDSYFDVGSDALSPITPATPAQHRVDISFAGFTFNQHEEGSVVSPARPPKAVPKTPLTRIKKNLFADSDQETGITPILKRQRILSANYLSDDSDDGSL